MAPHANLAELLEAKNVSVQPLGRIQVAKREYSSISIGFESGGANTGQNVLTGIVNAVAEMDLGGNVKRFSLRVESLATPSEIFLARYVPSRESSDQFELKRVESRPKKGNEKLEKVGLSANGEYRVLVSRQEELNTLEIFTPKAGLTFTQVVELLACAEEALPSFILPILNRVTTSESIEKAQSKHFSSY